MEHVLYVNIFALVAKRVNLKIYATRLFNMSALKIYSIILTVCFIISISQGEMFTSATRSMEAFEISEEILQELDYYILEEEYWVKQLEL